MAHDLIMSDFTIKVITSTENCPEDVIISGTGITDNYHHPVLLSKFEFFNLLDAMALTAERMILHEQLRDTACAMDDKKEVSKIKRKIRKIEYNWLYSRNYHETISLYFKMSRLEHGYYEFFNDMKKRKHHSSKHAERMQKWSSNARSLYRKLIINDEMK